MRGMRSLAVAALCLVSLFVGGTLVRVVLLLREIHSAVVLVGVTALLILIVWTTSRSGPLVTAYW